MSAPPGDELGDDLGDDSATSLGRASRLLLGLALLALAGIATIPLWQPPASSQPWRVRVVAPRIESLSPGLTDSRRQLLETAVLDALERQLSGRHNLRLVAPFEPLESMPTGDHLEPMADGDRNADELITDELITVAIDCGRRTCLGKLQRRRTVDGTTVGQGPRMLLDSDDLRLIDGRLAAVIDGALRDFPRHRHASQLFAETEDYESYLDLRRRLLDQPEAVQAERLLDQLVTVRHGSPRLFEAYTLASRLLIAGPADRQRAIELLEHAHRIAPVDLRAIDLLVPLLISEHRQGDAAEILRAVADLLPEDHQIAAWQQQID